MLLKLLKNDLKSTYPKMFTTFAIFIGLCIIAPLVVSQFGKLDAIVVASLADSGGTIALFIITFIFLFQRYNTNLYSNEGYLMFTLPTKGRFLLISKLLTALIWITIASVLALSAVGVMYYTFTGAPEAEKLISKSFGTLTMNASGYLLVLIEYIIGTLLFFLEVFFAISVSKLPVWRKCGVLMGFVAFFAVQVLEALPTWIHVRVRNNFAQMLDQAILSGKQITVFGSISQAYTWSNEWLSVTTSCVVSVLLFIGTTLLMEKKTSLK